MVVNLSLKSDTNNDSIHEFLVNRTLTMPMIDRTHCHVHHRNNSHPIECPLYWHLKMFCIVLLLQEKLLPMKRLLNRNLLLIRILFVNRSLKIVREINDDCSVVKHIEVPFEMKNFVLKILFYYSSTNFLVSSFKCAFGTHCFMIVVTSSFELVHGSMTKQQLNITLLRSE